MGSIIHTDTMSSKGLVPLLLDGVRSSKHCGSGVELVPVS